MEWLQTYKIGKQLIKSKQFNKYDCYYNNYRISKYENKVNGKIEYIEKEPYVIDFVINLLSNEVELDCRKYKKEYIQQENYFTSVTGHFTSYYLATNYEKRNSIIQFFEDKSVIQSSGIKKLGGFEKEYEGLIRDNLLKEDFKDSILIALREKVIKNKELNNKLIKCITSLPLLIEQRKKPEYDVKIDITNEKKKYDKAFADLNLKPLNARLNISKNGSHEVAMVTVKIIEKNDVETYLNRLDEYKDFCYNRFISLANIRKTSYQKEQFCYFTAEKGTYPVTLPRDNINLLKISTDTNKNFKSYFNGERFLMNKEAYESLKLGAWYIQLNLITKIAGINHYIIPDFNNELDLSKFKSELKSKIDLAFQDSKDYIRTRRRLENISKNGINSLTFIGYEIGQGEIDVINRIQSVTPDRYNLIIENLNNAKCYFDEHTSFSKDTLNFSFRTIYSIIPDREKNKAKYTLSLFKNLFEGNNIDKNFLLEHYRKLINLYWYSGPDKNKKFYVGTNNIFLFKNKEGKHKPVRDIAISVATIKYLILLKLINNLYNRNIMENEIINIEESPKTQTFFEEFDFNTSKKAMFYLGKLIRRVAEAQTKQEHKHKPILNRINYSGMKPDDIKILKVEVLEKMKQYNKSYKTFNYGQQDLAKFEYYFCKAEKNWELSVIESVFYLFTGYGMYWEVIEPQEKEALEDVDITPDKDYETEENTNNENN
ncbi:MAG: hypothetical protein KAT68_04210 [Bacteroidales bacterium]|nr:hypothetical protein [Bacteroidales bacterium]